MRIVTKQVTAAFLRGESKSVRNTSTDGKALYLHGNKIAEYRGGVLYVTDAGWPTRTTHDRLNALPGVRVNMRDRLQYLNGARWRGEWAPIIKTVRDAVLEAARQ